MKVERVEAPAPADLELLRDLWVRAWTRAWPGIDFEARRPWFANHLDGLLAGGAVLLVARGTEGPPLGFLTVHPATGEVDQLAVEPAAAGRGAGRALVEAAKRIGPGRLALTVNQGNARALRFYGRAGFVVAGEGVNPRSGLPTFLMDWPAPP